VLVGSGSNPLMSTACVGVAWFGFEPGFDLVSVFGL
jgi:hypothetical protein